MELQGMKSRLEKDVVYLQQARNVSPEELPASYRGLIDTLSAELREILRRYNVLLDNYLTDVVTSLVVLRDGPRMARGTSPTLIALAILAFSVLLALLAIVAEQLMQKALSQPR
jgi:hypothetical protein